MLPPEYNLSMARGWESKSVEEQQSQAGSSEPKSGPRPTPEQLARQRQRQGLLLSRARVRQQLEAAQNPQHRQLLELALAALDAQLAQLV
ncbi:conserved hypothetical protein [Candidatus Sulfotelmatobacter sp. SbA7]|nr:conserved hypothetical protein [Candidatus Sulfotelmatobacter sp. SbA7]